MDLFESIQPVTRPEPTKQNFDNAAFIKRNLMKSVDRAPEVYRLVEDWLFTFEGALTKVAFERQIKRLDRDDAIAITQLNKAKGRRVIPLPPPPKKPLLTKPIIEQIIETPYLAVYGRKFKPALKSAIQDLSACGKVYVLSVEQLILEFKTYEDKGSAPRMISSAIDCDFLFLVDLEMAIHLEWHIKEAIERIGRMREAKGLPIVSTWNRFNDCNEFFKRFSIFIVE